MKTLDKTADIKGGFSLNLIEKEAQLISSLKELDKVIVAFSGGVDSTYLAAMAYRVLGDNAVAISLHPEYVSNREIEEAEALAKHIGIQHKVIKINAFANEEITNNPPDRCFFCKTDLFTNIIQLGKEFGIENIIDGSNVDDMQDIRPGLKALKNLGVESPLKDAGLTKEEIRTLSNKIGLPTWDKPSFSCLATRIPYGERITTAKLEQIEAAEDLLFKLGVKQFRVRHFDTTAKIEVLPEDFGVIINNHNLIVTELKKLGFYNITLDLAGYRSGTLNQDLKKAE